jgi:CRP/FNR family transcriptional regulator, dissimilatory nitrate respiration regulator
MDLLTIDSLPSLLQNSTTIYSFAAGQRLFRQGDRSSNFFIVESGRIKLVRFTIEGRMVVLQVVRRGESLGENTFVSNAYSYTAIAEVESRAIAYPQPLFTEALDEYSELAENLREKLIEKIQSLKVSLELLQIRSAHLRLLQYLQFKTTTSDDQTVVNLDQPLKEVAAELDLTPRTISRALARLESEGRIIRQANSIILQTF